MNVNKSKSLIAVFIYFVVSSCGSSPTIVTSPLELFPDDVPSNICYLQVVRSPHVIGWETTWKSAGTLIEGKYLVTAAHNLYDSFWTKPTKVFVTCKDSSGNVVTSIISSEGIDATRELSHYDNSFSQDYAFIKLEELIGVKDEIHLNEIPDFEKISKIEVAGYPGGKLKHGKGDIIKPLGNGTTFKYNVTTSKGMSGGPVWDKNLLIGIHGFPSGGRKVDNELLTKFLNWKKLNP